MAGCPVKEKLDWRQHPGIDPPTLPNQPRADCREGGQVLAEKKIPKLDDCHHPRSCLAGGGVMKMFPVFVLKNPPGFIPRDLSRGLVRDRRVGGLKPWRSGLVQSLLTTAPFELVRSPTHHFPSRLGVIRSKKRRIGAENGGLDSVQDWRAVLLKRSWIGDNIRESTHPRSRTSPVRIAARGDKSWQKKNSRNWMIVIIPGVAWQAVG